MRRVGVIGFGVLGWLLCAAPGAAELAALQQSIDAKAAELAAVRAELVGAQQGLAALEAERTRLDDAAEGLVARRDAALAALRAQFEKVVADPSLPLEPELRAYRQAVTAQADRVTALAAQEQQIAAARERIEGLRATAEAEGAAVAQLRSGLGRARAQRLLREINVAGEERLTNAIVCAPEETIAGCIERGEQTAQRVARGRFADELFAGVTESDVVARYRVEAGVEPALVASEVMDSGFRGQGEYFVTLQAQLRNEATLADACRLLGLTDAECQGMPAAPATEPRPAAPAAEPDLQPEVAMAGEAQVPADALAGAADDSERYQLTVRSNVYYDEVYIDGVPYGSTKLDVMLPPGEYDVEVRKPGHEPYRERVDLTASRTLRAQLAELREP
jgi:hypothetical protein